MEEGGGRWEEGGGRREGISGQAVPNLVRGQRIFVVAELNTECAPY